MTEKTGVRLDGARILVTNDDGIDAEGIALLERAALAWSDDVWVVAPVVNQSATGRKVSLRRRLKATRTGPRHYAIDGTPGDCVIAALNGLLPAPRPDIVLSGVNQGSNLGDDVLYSGTVAACLESAEQGVPALAFSQVRAGSHGDPMDWGPARAHLQALLPTLAAALERPRSLLNVNFPARRSGERIAGLEVAEAGWRAGPTSIQTLESDADGATFWWDGLRAAEPSSDSCDLAWSARGYVTVTPLGLDLTDRAQIAAVDAALGTASLEPATSG